MKINEVISVPGKVSAWEKLSAKKINEKLLVRIEALTLIKEHRYKLEEDLRQRTTDMIDSIEKEWLLLKLIKSSNSSSVIKVHKNLNILKSLLDSF